MRVRKALLAPVAMTALLASACGNPGGTAASSARTAVSPPSVAASSATYAPVSTTNTLNLLPPRSKPDPGTAQVSSIRCTGPIGTSDSVAVVQLHSGAWVLRDYADPAHPRTVCELPLQADQARIIDAHHLLIGGPNYIYAVVQVPELIVTWFELPSGQFASLIAVSPNLDQIAYLTTDVASNSDEVHVVSAAGDTVVATLPNPHLGRCGSPEDSRSGEYTLSGNALYVLDQPAAGNSLAIVKDVTTRLKLIPPGNWPQGTQPEMALWSPTTETLYYRYKGDVWKWTASGGAQKFLLGVSWYYATISADGKHLAYAVLRPDGLHNVYIVDLAAGGSPQLIGKGPRTVPVFLNTTQLWYRAEQQVPCALGGGSPFVYDLSDGSESASVVDFVVSVWPSTSSNF